MEPAVVLFSLFAGSFVGVSILTEDRPDKHSKFDAEPKTRDPAARNANKLLSCNSQREQTIEINDVHLSTHRPVMACPTCTSMDQPPNTQALTGLVSYRQESSNDGSICSIHIGSRSCSLLAVIGSIFRDQKKRTNIGGKRTEAVDMSLGVSGRGGGGGQPARLSNGRATFLRECIGGMHRFRPFYPESFEYVRFQL